MFVIFLFQRSAFCGWKCVGAVVQSISCFHRKLPEIMCLIKRWRVNIKVAITLINTITMFLVKLFLNEVRTMVWC